MLTGAWAAITIPNIAIWHREGIEWLVEGLHMAISLSIGVLVAVLVEHEAAARRRAEALASRLSRTNRLILQAQEAERLRISRDLHDSTVQGLVHLCHRLDAVSRAGTNADAIRDALLEARAVAKRALSDARGLSRDLRPSILDDLGLVAALDWLVRGPAGAIGASRALRGPGHRQTAPARTRARALPHRTGGAA